MFLRKSIVFSLVFSLFSTLSPAATQFADFEDINLSPGAYWNESDDSSGFYSSFALFNNRLVDWGGGTFSWSGFAVSRVENTETAGYMNQFAVWGNGKDVSGDGAYAVAYVDEGYGLVPTITLPGPALVRGLYVNNTTYAALSIRDGDSFATPFSVARGDWFLLTITGRDQNGASLGEIEVYLADYRERPFILDQWRWVDLAAFGSDVRRLEFRLTSSDVGTWGMNTPAYFALDGLEYLPRPTSAVVTLNDVDIFPEGTEYWNGSDLRGFFADSGVIFSNSYDIGYGSWYGFALSKVNDTTTAGYLNQYAVWGDGQDFDGDGRYVVAYQTDWDPDATQIKFPYDVTVEGFYINNTTYAALAMRDSNYPSKKFGGASGNDPDWFKLEITGKNADGKVIGTTEFYLADFRFDDNSQDYIISDWTWVDLSGFTNGVRSLHFALSSSDNGAWGMNTPSYFALDNLTYRAAAGGAFGNEGSVLDRGVPSYVIIDEEEVLNPLFVGWASTVIDYSPTPGVDSQWSDPNAALGPVDQDNTNVVSLGDREDPLQPAGSITLGFAAPIRDGAGPDFAVFENGFAVNDTAGFFAELAYVEVSSDGVNFARFPSRSDTPAKVGPYGYITSSHVWNLAGKHSNTSGAHSTAGDKFFGTPFDLADLADHPLVLSGLVDLGNITQVRIVDIPGDGSEVDSYGQPIYDAWLTWGSGGFDLKGIGVINSFIPGTTAKGVPLNWIADQRLVGEAAEAANSDLDNDGFPAWAEFFAGTSPNDSASYLHLTGVERDAAGQTSVTWLGGGHGGSELDFTLQVRSSLETGNWEDLEIAVPRQGGKSQSWQGTLSGDAAFFRVLVKTPDL